MKHCSYSLPRELKTVILKLDYNKKAHCHSPTVSRASIARSVTLKSARGSTYTLVMIRHESQVRFYLMTITHPDVWKWNKTFLNHLFELDPNKVMDSIIFIVIITHFTATNSPLTGSKLF